MYSDSNRHPSRGSQSLLQQRQRQRHYVSLIQSCAVILILMGENIGNWAENKNIKVVGASSSFSTHSRISSIRQSCNKGDALFSLRCGYLSDEGEDNDDAALDAYVESLIRDVELSQDEDEGAEVVTEDEEDVIDDEEEDDMHDEEEDVIDEDEEEEHVIDDEEEEEDVIDEDEEETEATEEEDEVVVNLFEKETEKDEKEEEVLESEITEKKRTKSSKNGKKSHKKRKKRRKETTAAVNAVSPTQEEEENTDEIEQVQELDDEAESTDDKNNLENKKDVTNMDDVASANKEDVDKNETILTSTKADGDITSKSKSNVSRKKKTKSSSTALELPQSSSPQQQQQPPPPPAKPMPPPNAIYRFLLTKGPIGHYIITLSTLLTQLLQTYLPEFYSTLRLLLSKLGIYDSEKAYAKFLKSQKSYSMKQPQMSSTTIQGKTNVNEKYAAFVSTDGMSSGSKKATTKQKKQMDDIAVWKLKRVGDVRMVKYRHLSLGFMKRHELGPYNIEKEKKKVASSIAKDVLTEMDASSSSTAGTTTATTKDKEEESDMGENEDDDWVVQALKEDDNDVDTAVSEEEEDGSLSSVLFGLSSLGNDENEGGGSTLGSTRSQGTKKRKIRKSSSSSSKSAVLKAALASRQAIQTSTTKKKSQSSSFAGSDGGSAGGNVFGRIRSAATSNSYISSTRILGAYPGDAVPRDEAGSADGVVALARKYGYGDWSDSDEEEEEDDEDDYDLFAHDDFGEHSYTYDPQRKSNVRISSSSSSSVGVRRVRRRKKKKSIVRKEGGGTTVVPSTKNAGNDDDGIESDSLSTTELKPSLVLLDDHTDEDSKNEDVLTAKLSSTNSPRIKKKRKRRVRVKPINEEL